jgi:hypothetical protein
MKTMHKRTITKLMPEMKEELLELLRLNGLDDRTIQLKRVVSDTAMQRPDVSACTIKKLAAEATTAKRPTGTGSGGGKTITPKEIAAVKKLWDSLGFQVGNSCRQAVKEIAPRLGMNRQRCYNIIRIKLKLCVPWYMSLPERAFARCSTMLARMTEAEQEEFTNKCKEVQPSALPLER